MEGKIRKGSITVLVGMMLFLSAVVSAANGEKDDNKTAGTTKSDTAAVAFINNRSRLYDLSSDVDSFPFRQRFIHRLEVEGRPAYIFQTNSFLRGDNGKEEPLRQALSFHLKYAFQFHPHTYAERVYGGAYQGLGFGRYAFGNSEELGNPWSVYVFQGARIARFNSRLSLNYEWNLGASFGWKPYDSMDNYRNKIIGSKVNAYINLNLYLNWMISRHVDLIAGVSATHFSNGNTKFPNAGLNTGGAKIGFAYYFNRKDDAASPYPYQLAIPKFPRHISYDVVLFGSWRRKGVGDGDVQTPSPDAYPVMGFNITPLYNINYKLRAGVSIDGVYDQSANVYLDRYYDGTEEQFKRPPARYQMALGLSGRVEYVMPYFTVGLGIGANVLHRGGDLRGLYQVLVLKVDVTRNLFLHVGYNLQDFHDPNYLMLGIGYHFNNKRPRFHR